MTTSLKTPPAAPAFPETPDGMVEVDSGLYYGKGIIRDAMEVAEHYAQREATRLRNLPVPADSHAEEQLKRKSEAARTPKR